MTMKTAIKGDQLIHLNTLNRSTYQQLFEESKKGQWQCPACSENVRLILGIEQDPYFQHVSNKNTICQFEASEREVAVTNGIRADGQWVSSSKSKIDIKI